MTYKLTYFDFPGGRGEDCRLALHIAGVDFEDDRVKHGTWMDRRKDTPFGVLPIMSVEGKGTLSQSNAILTYIGRAHGLHPDDIWEAARHDEIMASVEDLRQRVTVPKGASDEEKQALRKELADGWMKKWADSIEDRIQGPFLAGSQINVADLKLFNVMSWFKRGGVDHIATDYFDAFPKLDALHAAVAAHPKVTEWYAS